MNNKNLIWTLIYIFYSTFMQAQEIKSEKSYIRINNKPKKEVVVKPDKIPPEIKIISPAVTKGVKYKSVVPEINLVGKAVLAQFLLILS
ncbi:hypothetical protein ES708_29332 [subsurface metagenome]